MCIDVIIAICGLGVAGHLLRFGLTFFHSDSDDRIIDSFLSLDSLLLGVDEERREHAAPLPRAVIRVRGSRWFSLRRLLWTP